MSNPAIDRPAFSNLDDLRDYAIKAMDNTTCAGVKACGVRLDVVLGGVAMTVDCKRNDQGESGQSCTVQWAHN